MYGNAPCQKAMQKVKISTDSTADIPKKFCEELGISVLPLTVITEDGTEYRDGIDIAPTEFYHIIDTSKKLPVSSQVTALLYARLYEETWQAGYTDLIHTTVNSKGSGTYQAAVIAKEMFFEEYPDVGDQFHIHLIDSKTYSMAYGIPVIEAARMAQTGGIAEDIIEHITEWITHARPMFVPLNLRCVKKSGRISPAAAFLGDAIGLKPMITFEDGEAKIVGKVRGEQKAITALIETCLKERKPGSSYAIVYGNNTDAYERLKAACADAMDQPPLANYEVGCVISINTGPDMVGIIYRT